MENDTYTVDITPSWRFIVKGFLQVLKSHSKKSLSDADFWTIRTELLKCSNLADLYNEEAEKERQFQYNGWTNKVTHTIMSQIDNDEGLRNWFMNESRESIRGSGLYINDRITLGQYIKDYFLDQKPTISKDSFTLDHYNESMLSWAYDMVNWEEIAEHILDAVAEETE